MEDPILDSHDRPHGPPVKGPTERGRTEAVGGAPDRAEGGVGGRILPLAMTALVFLFVAEGQRAYFASFSWLVHDAIAPRVTPGAALVALLPLCILLGPFVPLARLRDRRAAVAVSAASVAVFRLLMAYPGFATRLIGGGLVLAGGAVFLMWAVGHLERRAVAAGLVAGLLADQLLRLVGLSYDVSLRPSWLPAQAVLSALLVGLAVASTRDVAGGPIRRAGASDLERREGGLRLRGALAVGALLFVDLHVLGAPPVVARSTGVGYTLAAMAVTVAGAAALAVALVARRPTGGRAVTLAMTALAMGAPLASVWLNGASAALLMAAGHGGALLLMSRALEPASGRRQAGAAAAALAVLIAATALYGASLYSGGAVPRPGGVRPWLFGGLAVLVAGCFVLLPRPAALAGSLGATAAATVAAVAVAVSVFAVPGWVREGGPPAPPAPAGDTLTVATWNLRQDLVESRGFEPERVADALVSVGAEVVAIREAPAGLPWAYGMDLPLWLGHRLGAATHVGARAFPVDAFLSRVAVEAGDTVPVPGDPGGTILRLVVATATGGIALHAVPTVAGDGDPSARVEGVLAAIEPGPALLLIRLAAPDRASAAALGSAGFTEPLEGAPSGPASSAEGPPAPDDRIWVRAADAAEGPGAAAGAAVTPLQVVPRPVR